MALNYAEVWSPDLLEIMEQESLISPFITTAVKRGRHIAVIPYSQD